jgi:hypothetical protein
MRVPFFIGINKLKIVTHGGKHAFTNMVSRSVSAVRSQNKDTAAGCEPGSGVGCCYRGVNRKGTPPDPTYRGNLSASRTTTSIPSRASADAAKDPPGPPPATRTVVLSGMLVILIAWRQV